MHHEHYLTAVKALECVNDPYDTWNTRFRMALTAFGLALSHEPILVGGQMPVQAPWPTKHPVDQWDKNMFITVATIKESL